MNLQQRPLKLCRSWLFVSGLSTSVPTVLPDVIVFDFDEFTPHLQLKEAYENIQTCIPILQKQGIRVAVRTRLYTHGGSEDIQQLGKHAPDFLLLPQVESADVILDTAEQLANYEQVRGIAPGSIAVVPTIESALGLHHSVAIFTAHPRVQAALLAAEDLSADLNLVRWGQLEELQFQRQLFLMNCRAAKIVAIDCPYSTPVIDDFRTDLEWAWHRGFRAKCIVLNEQLSSAHQILTPEDPTLLARIEHIRNDPQASAPSRKSAERVFSEWQNHQEYLHLSQARKR